jgi:hypothetical protein
MLKNSITIVVQVEEPLPMKSWTSLIKSIEIWLGVKVSKLDEHQCSAITQENCAKNPRCEVVMEGKIEVNCQAIAQILTLFDFD